MQLAELHVFVHLFIRIWLHLLTEQNLILNKFDIQQHRYCETDVIRMI